MPHRHVIDVHVLLLDGDRVLLTRRRDDHPEFDDQWHLPSGKLDADESVLHAAAREANEEIGVLIAPADLEHVHTVHVAGPGPESRLGLFFAARRWTGTPYNREPAKCSGLTWFDVDGLPADTIAYPATGIRGYRSGSALTITGWHPATAV